MPGEDSRLMYGPIIALVREIVEQMIPARCDVAIVYSMNRYAEICRIGGDTILVYDRYVGQAINTFMRILAWSKNPLGSARAFARIYAEQAVLAGDAAGAIAGSIMFEETSPHWNLPHVVDNPEVKLQVQLQEMFIFAHEYCHLLMAASKDFRKSRHKIGNMLLEPSETSRDEEAYAEFVARYPDEAESGFEHWLSMARDQDRFIFENAAALRDELSCDDLALHVTLIACKQLGVNPRFGFEAAFLALRNIRALAYIREAANPGRFARSGPFGPSVRMLQARQHKLRSAYRLVAAVHGLEKELEDVLADLMDLSDRHDDKVDNPLLFNILENLTAIRAELAVDNPDLDIAMALRVAEDHGWDPHATEVEYILV